MNALLLAVVLIYMIIVLVLIITLNKDHKQVQLFSFLNIGFYLVFFIITVIMLSSNRDFQKTMRNSKLKDYKWKDSEY